MNENEMKLTPAEVEQVENALAEEAGPIPELLELIEAASATRLPQSMFLYEIDETP